MKYALSLLGDVGDRALPLVEASEKTQAEIAAVVTGISELYPDYLGGQPCARSLCRPRAGFGRGIGLIARQAAAP